MKTLIIKDIPHVEELSNDAARSIAGGRINDPPLKPVIPEYDGIAGGPLHVGDDRFSILWPHNWPGKT
jgi:hypothetical protein